MNYEINNSTLAVIPTGERKCQVLEGNNTYDLNKTSFKVIEHSCEYFGVSYKSRLKGSQNFIKTRYKTPIIIEESSKIVFFPIASPTKANTIWISYNNIVDFLPGKQKNETIIKFKNGFKMEISISFYSFNNQYSKASRLYAVLSSRINNND